MEYSRNISEDERRRIARGPTTMQIRAYIAVRILQIPQQKVAAMFGVRQPAISKRLQRYRERVEESVVVAAMYGRRRRLTAVRPLALSFLHNV